MFELNSGFRKAIQSAKVKTPKNISKARTSKQVKQIQEIHVNSSLSYQCQQLFAQTVDISKLSTTGTKNGKKYKIKEVSQWNSKDFVDYMI